MGEGRFERREGRGGPFAVWVREDLPEVVLGSRFDPHDHARRTVTGFKRHPQQAAVIISPGLTGLGKAAVEAGFAAVLQVEADPDLMAMYEAASLPGALPVLYKPAASELHTWMQSVLAPGAPPPALIWAHPALKEHPAFTRLSRDLNQGLAKAESLSKTVQKAGGVFLQNLLDNVPSLCQGGSLAALKDCLKGRPLVLAGAGPSLPAALPLLEARLDIPVFAADMAWFPLQRLGRSPDAVVTVDPYCINLMKIHPERAIPAALVASAMACPGVIRRFTGPRYFTLPYAPFREALGFHEEPQLSGMGAVGSHLIALGLMTGADPLILAGLDFAPLGRESYAPGQFWERFDMGALDESGQVEIEGMEGGMLWTRPAYAAAVEAVNDQLKCAGKSTPKVLNMGRGAKIHGATLADTRALVRSLPVKNPWTPPPVSPEESKWRGVLETISNRWQALAAEMASTSQPDSELAAKVDSERLLHEGLGQATAGTVGDPVATWRAIQHYVAVCAEHLKSMISEDPKKPGN